MPQFNRSLFNAKGPVRAVYAGAEFYHNGDAKLDLALETMKVKPDGFATADERPVDLIPKISLTPAGDWTAAIIAALWPHLAGSRVGVSLFTDTDVPLVLHGQNAELWTMKAAAVTKMPDIIFSVNKTLVGSAEFTCLRANAALPTDADAIFTMATTGGTFKRALWRADLIKTQRYTLTLGTKTGFQTIDTEDGITFSPSMSLQSGKADGLGTITMWATEIGGMIKFKPLNPTVANALAAFAVQGAGAALGRSLAGDGVSVQIIGDDGITYLSAPLATIKTAGFVFGEKPLRNGEFGLLLQRDYNSDGSEKALCTLNAGAAVIVVLPTTLPAGTEDEAYAQVLSATGGVGPYTFTKSAGDLPTGLTLSEVGVLSGTPSAAGSFTFTVTATDYNGATGTREYTVVIAAARS